ncbi:hypothetical protein ACPPVO_02260 [Dactylosporangium sp. McL0621]|uniref:hypothetical protein n=1 Tax=Dactylosporangium sp. McL0621 TaxID=3415678 RepID=UPI003CE89D69
MTTETASEEAADEAAEEAAPAEPEPAEPTEPAEPPADEPKETPDLDLGRVVEDRARATHAESEKIREQVSNVNMHFYSEVNATGAQFGVLDDGERRAGGQRKVTGKLSAAEIDAITSTYAEPECFPDTVAKLQQDRVVVIEGRPGLGRRAGAISLLRRVTRGEIVVLSPLNTPQQLAERVYEAAKGYLVLDQVRERGRADVEFSWSSLRQHVDAAKAFLVITNDYVGVAAGSIARVPWSCPPVAEVLRAHLAGHPDLEQIVAAVLASLPEDASPAKVAALAARIRDEGLTVDEALRKQDESAQRQVREWFAGGPSQRELHAVTAACFLAGTDVRTYETLLELLHEIMAQRVEGRTARAELRRRDASIFGEREARLHDTSLIVMSDVPWRGGTIQRIEFKEPAYRRYVLAVLWRSQTIHFWNAVREWLDAAVATDAGDVTAISSGLAWLACCSVDEVQRSYLDRWSTGAIGLPGQIMTAYVLWLLCHRDGLEPVALETAVRWAQDKVAARRWTAAVALGGELGMYFPSDAVNRLWQLGSQTRDDVLFTVSCIAMANLFTTLRDDEHGDPSIVLGLLEKKMASFGTGDGRRPGKGPMPWTQLVHLRDLTMLMTLSVVRTRSFRTARPAIAEYLYTDQDRMEQIARIWAGVLVYRPLRWEAFAALRAALHALPDISKEPSETARAFGRALAAALPTSEREAFQDTFIRVDERIRKGRREPLAEVLVACLEAIAVKIRPEGRR